MIYKKLSLLWSLSSAAFPNMSPTFLQTTQPFTAVDLTILVSIIGGSAITLGLAIRYIMRGNAPVKPMSTANGHTYKEAYETATLVRSGKESMVVKQRNSESMKVGT